MRYRPIPSSLFVENRKRLKSHLQPNSLAVVNNNDVLPTNADGSLLLFPSSDLFYLTGIEQEESILLLYPDSSEEKFKEILFLRDITPMTETWEGKKLDKAEASRLSGISTVEWLSSFPALFRRLMCESDNVYLNSNEHKRASLPVETRESRFVAECQKNYPLHHYHRLAKILHRLRAVKSSEEVALIRQVCDITEAGFRRVARYLKAGVTETEVEAEFAHEFIRRGGGFAYSPIIASGVNACALHYIQNDKPCEDGDLVLLDVAASYAHYNSDLTRTLPVNGRFSRRQRAVYNSVLKVLKKSAASLVPGKLIRDWQKEAEGMIEYELLELGLLKSSQIKKQDKNNPAFRKYFMHGVGHPIGLDVHDVGITTEPMQAGWVMTCEPAIYIREEAMAIRLENDYLITDNGPVNLLQSVPMETEDIEALMAKKLRK
ncbi:MAG: pepP [Verrucomicrobiales bacterium]|nr:pepP [Verrucomicrobiales bacterium]